MCSEVAHVPLNIISGCISFCACGDLIIISGKQRRLLNFCLKQICLGGLEACALVNQGRKVSATYGLPTCPNVETSLAV